MSYSKESKDETSMSGNGRQKFTPTFPMKESRKVRNNNNYYNNSAGTYQGTCKVTKKYLAKTEKKIYGLVKLVFGTTFTLDIY